MNTYYHASREAFLDGVHRWFMFAVIVLGATALIDIFPNDKQVICKAVCSAATAIVAALDLVFDFSNRARSHALLRRRYFELLAEVKEGAKTPEQAQMLLDRISGDEEPQYRVVLLASWNMAQKTVFGLTAKYFNIDKPSLVFKNWFRRPSANFTVIEPPRGASH